MQTAIQLPKISPFSLEFGSMTTVQRNVIFPDSSILGILPNWEQQSMVYGDTWGCVAHSFENAAQILTQKLLPSYRYDNQDWLIKNYEKDNYIDFSDRDLVVLSGTVPRVGNSGDKVADTARTRGLISQALGDWDMFDRNPNKTIDRYYNYLRTEESEELAQEWLRRMDSPSEWVPRERWEEASKEGILQVYVNAWWEKDGEYYNPSNTYNHAVIMADYNQKLILDTYKPELKKMRSWNDAYYWALKINIYEKPMNKPNIQNNSLVILTEGNGGIGLYLDDKIIIDDVGKIMAVYMGRNAKNNQFTGGPVMSLSQANWDMFDKYNLKMERI